MNTKTETPDSGMNVEIPLSVMRTVWLADAIAKYPLERLIECLDEGIAHTFHEAAISELRRLSSQAMDDAADFEMEVRTLAALNRRLLKNSAGEEDDNGEH
ncbi:MAG: hypothetical protein FKY71_15265 [Spiribacter salinus]|uniref:Uncharacterized protein n=1 Tax=Spiribacter salinus TaxID=1335746 RepID=A0A540VN16_9GAMM|nr:MAG: hypothetical protein FKY71_15265 [Spiribacter salinus]